MSQFDFGVIDPQVKTGSQLAADLNAWRDALNTVHMGAARPAYAVAGTLWIDSSTPPAYKLKVFDGVADIVIFNFNNSTHAGGDDRKYDKTGGQINGNVQLVGAARRILGDFGGAVADRTMFKTGTANTNTLVSTLPDGTGAVSGFRAYGSSDLINGVSLAMTATGSGGAVGILSENYGSGSPVPMQIGIAALPGRLRFETDGRVLNTNPAGIGYGVGAGGSGAQGASKSDPVTINRPSGRITLSSQSIPAGGTFNFTLNNSTIGAEDTLSLSTTGGISDAKNLFVWAYIAGAGQAVICGKNNSAAALADVGTAINFNVIKGANT